MMRSGRRVFRYPYGTYTPVISDGHRIYLTGYSSITALQPYDRQRLRAARAQLRREGKVAGVVLRHRVKKARQGALEEGKSRRAAVRAGREARRRIEARARAIGKRLRRRAAAAAGAESPARKQGSAASGAGS
jgi:hypothetical protein